MAKVSHKVVLSFQGGPVVTLPDNLLATGENGTQYLKLRASSPIIAKLLAGHLENFKTLSKPSLAGSKQFLKLKEMFDTALHGHNVAEESKSMFGEGAESQDVSKKANKANLTNAPQTLTLTLEGQEVHCLTPSTFREKDVCVALDEAQLTAVFSFLQRDCHEVLCGDKRQYRRTGAFSKKAVPEAESEHEDCE